MVSRPSGPGCDPSSQHPRGVGGSFAVLFAAWGRQGAEDGEGAAAGDAGRGGLSWAGQQQGWAGRGKVSGCPALPTVALVHTQDTPFPALSAPGLPRWEWGCAAAARGRCMAGLGPSRLSPGPLCAPAAQGRTMLQCPQDSQSPFSIPPQFLQSRQQTQPLVPSAVPCPGAGAPWVPSQAWGWEEAAQSFQDCDPRSLPEPRHRGCHPWEGGCHSQSDTNAFSCLPHSRCIPLCRAWVPQSRWVTLCGDHRVMLAARGHLSTGTVPAAASGQMAAWPEGRATGDSADVALTGKDVPTPPGSTLSASQETKALFVLSQTTQEIGKVPNFSAGATAFATSLLSPFPDLAGTSLLL